MLARFLWEIELGVGEQAHDTLRAWVDSPPPQEIAPTLVRRRSDSPVRLAKRVSAELQEVVVGPADVPGLFGCTLECVPPAAPLAAVAVDFATGPRLAVAASLSTPQRLVTGITLAGYVAFGHVAENPQALYTTPVLFGAPPGFDGSTWAVASAFAMEFIGMRDWTTGALAPETDRAIRVRRGPAAKIIASGQIRPHA